MLPARHRLRHRRDFAVAVRGTRAGNRLVVVHAARPGDRVGMPARVGLAVSRAVGNSVVRNRAKRVLRARLAHLVPELPSGTDIVVRAQPQLVGADGADLSEALVTALQRAVSGAARRAEA